METLTCAEHLLSRSGRPCEKPIVLFCGSCLSPIATEDIQYDNPFKPCPHGCGHIIAGYKKRCKVHQDLLDPSICESCGKDHPDPSGVCFFDRFYSEYCRVERKWSRQRGKLEDLIACVKLPPAEYIAWLEKRFRNHADEDDKVALFMIDAYENWREPEMARMAKEVRTNLARGRRNQIPVKRVPGKWYSNIKY